MRSGDLRAQVAFLAKRLRGARVLSIGVTAPLREALLEAGAASVADGPEGLDGSAYDLVWIHGDDTDLSLAAVAVATRGWAVFSLPGDGASYAKWLERLRAHFASVEVATQSPVLGSFLSLWGQEHPRLEVDGRYAPAPIVSSYLLICGAQPSQLLGQLLVPLAADDGAASRVEALQQAWAAERLRADALEEALRSARESERDKERQRRGDEPEARQLEALERRVRDLREREEMARSRALDAEERLREVERSLEAERASRADASAALRGQRLRAERAQRDAEGVMDAITERDRLLESWKERALEAERRIATLEGRLVRTQALGGT